MQEEAVHILLVDDDARNLNALESILETSAYRLVRAQSGEEALMALIAQDFAAIVLDIRMPGMSGLELAQIIKQRKKTRHIPIIFLTGYYQEDKNVLEGYGAGAVDYISKPCHPSILRSKVAVFVDLFRKTRALKNEIAERTLAEQKVRQLNDQLARRISDLAAANAELEAFSYTVSHDLRAPLRQAAGFAALLKKAAADRLDSEACEYLALIQHSVERMGRLIDDLLAFSRFGRVALRDEVIDLEHLVAQARQSCQPAALDRQVEWKIGPLPEIRGDAALLLQVLINLLDNALKFTRLMDTARIEIGFTPAPGEDVVFVRDNGVGFDPQYAQNLFGVFQRLHSATEFEGNGIGLAGARRIIQRHGGRMWAESSPGQGATFYFSLPNESATSRGNPNP